MAALGGRAAVVIWLITLLVDSNEALENGLALTPPMGWLAWERFTCETDCASQPENCISRRLFQTMADQLVGGGFLEAGYQYINIDDCWSELERDNSSNRLVPDRRRFPAGGIAALADYVHAKGLKLGLYGDCGAKTCAGYPAQLPQDLSGSPTNNHFELDARTLADWQVDSFKFDGCYIDPLKAESICPLMALALNTTGRPILLVCEWPFYMMYAHAKPNFELAGEACNVWRYYDDIEDSWSSILNTIDYSVKHQSTIVKYHGPGHWFDPDQLVVGNFGLSAGQARAQMALWCLWSAPLYMSNDLRSISRDSADLLKNKHLIGVNQDPLGVWALMVGELDSGQLQAFVKPIQPVRNGCPSFAVLYLNRRTLGNKTKVSFRLRDLLAAAPVLQAAKHQASNEARSGRQVAAEARIAAFKCKRRLQTDDRNTSKGRKERTLYQSYDLLDGGRPLSVIELDSELELLVEPSSVRAIRLEEVVV